MPARKSVIDVDILYAKELSRIVKELNVNVVKSVKLANRYVQKFFMKYEEPYTEISQNMNHFFVEMKLPGSYKKDVVIRLVNYKLEVEALRYIRDAQRPEVRGYYRTVDLPKIIDTKKISARFKSEKLKVRIPFKRD